MAPDNPQHPYGHDPMEPEHQEQESMDPLNQQQRQLLPGQAMHPSQHLSLNGPLLQPQQAMPPPLLDHQDLLPLQQQQRQTPGLFQPLQNQTSNELYLGFQQQPQNPFASQQHQNQNPNLSPWEPIPTSLLHQGPQYQSSSLFEQPERQHRFQFQPQQQGLQLPQHQQGLQLPQQQQGLQRPKNKKQKNRAQGNQEQQQMTPLQPSGFQSSYRQLPHHSQGLSYQRQPQQNLFQPEPQQNLFLPQPQPQRPQGLFGFQSQPQQQQQQLLGRPMMMQTQTFTGGVKRAFEEINSDDEIQSAKKIQSAQEVQSVQEAQSGGEVQPGEEVQSDEETQPDEAAQPDEVAQPNEQSENSAGLQHQAVVQPQFGGHPLVQLPFVSSPTANQTRFLDQLPEDVITMILTYLDHWDFLSCRRVSSTMRSTIGSSQLAREFLRAKFPLSRSLVPLTDYATVVNKANAAEMAARAAGVQMGEEALDLAARIKADWAWIESQPWTRFLLDTIRRQLSIETGTYSKLKKIEARGDVLWFIPVVPWGLPGFTHYYERHADPAWAYDQHTGILVYFSPEKKAYVAALVTAGIVGPEVDIGFDVNGRFIRRVRMTRGVLAFEWAQGACHISPPADHVHQHSVTIFDLKCDESGKIQVTPRFSWVICPEGFIIATAGEDTFFSAHNETHYAIYLCLKNRGTKRRSGAITETVIVWDIRRSATQTAPVIVRNLDPGDRIMKDVRSGSEGGRPRFLRLHISHSTLGADDSLQGYVFFHLEHRNMSGAYHQVSSIGLPLDEDEEVRANRCAKPCHQPTPRDHRHTARAPDWPGWAPHWRHWVRNHDSPTAYSEDLPNMFEVANVHNVAAGVSMNITWKKMETGVRIEQFNGYTIDPARRSVYRSMERFNIFGRYRPSIRQSDYIMPGGGAFDDVFHGRFVVFGDETMLIGEGLDGSIQIMTL